MATFSGQAATNNTFAGTAAADTFLWAAADLDNLDHATGGGGSDLLKLTSAGALAATALTGLSGIERYQLAAGGNAITLTNANFTGVTGAKILIKGGAGDDTVNASALTGKNAIDVTAGAGLDSFTGGAGSDVFRFGAADLNGDPIAGGAGRDLLLLTSAGTLGVGVVAGMRPADAPASRILGVGVVSPALANMTGVETIQFAAGGNDIVLSNSNFTGVAHAKIVVHGSAGNDTVNAIALTGVNAIDVTAGAGNDNFMGGAGRDTFRFKAADLSHDIVRGLTGRDLLLLTTAGALANNALDHMEGIDVIKLAKGGNSLFLLDGNYGHIPSLRISVIGGAGDDTVNAGNLIGQLAIDVRAGGGMDTLTGGAGRDTFRFKVADLTDDTVHGNGGLDQLLLADGGALAAGALANVDGVESIHFAKAGNSITLADANFTGVTSGKITVIGGAGNDKVDGSSLSGAHAIDVTAGAGSDELRGGAGNDTFRFDPANLDRDTIVGGDGMDTLVLTRAGALAATALQQMTGVETIRLSSGGNDITLTDNNFPTGPSITVIGGAGADRVDGGTLFSGNSIKVTAGGGLDTLIGGAGDDTFMFRAADLAGDTVTGGAGIDTLKLQSGGVLSANALAHVTGIDTIDLAEGGNGITLTDANFADPLLYPEIGVVCSSGDCTIDGTALTGNNGVSVLAGSGLFTVFGGGGSDFVTFDSTHVFQTGDRFDGGGGVDAIGVGTSMSLLGNGITNVEQLLAQGGAGLSITISGENAAGFLLFGRNATDGLTDTYTVDLRADSTTDLSHLQLANADAGDAIHVVSASGNTAVTLSSWIAHFTGSADSDTVSLAAGAHYRTGAVIDGGGGDDRIVFDADARTLEGGAGSDTLVLRSGETVDLSFVNGGTVVGTTSVLDFENIDASQSAAAVTLTGRNDVASVLIGTSGDDHIFAGQGGATITGGLGADTLTGSAGDDRFHIRSTAEAQGDTINGLGGGNGIDVLGNTDFSFTKISNIQTLYLAAGDGAGTFTGDALTATVTGSQAKGLTDLFGNGYFPDSVETLVVNMDSYLLDLSNLHFAYWGGGDHVVINDTGAADIITGTSMNDVIHTSGGGDRISGGEGDDQIGYVVGATVAIDGGSGTDTIVMEGSVASGNGTVAIDLQTGKLTETFGGNAVQRDVTTVENVDFSASGYTTSITGNDGANVLIGGDGNATINGGLGADTLTGGAGLDKFVWNSKLEGGDTITDFTSGADTLTFAAAAFPVFGSFDAVAVDTGSGTVNIAATDLLFVGGRTLNSATEVRAYVDGLKSQGSHGMFLLATDTHGDHVLYYTGDVSDKPDPGVDNAFYQIADLGAAQLQGQSDFVFI